jgi:hypothetical protein
MYITTPGNEKPLRRAGVNYDDWPMDVYKSTPYFTLDPAATHGRRMAQAYCSVYCICIFCIIFVSVMSTLYFTLDPAATHGRRVAQAC